MKLKCVMAWQRYSKGAVIEQSGLQAQTLLAMRFAGRAYWERVAEPELPTAAPAAEHTDDSRAGHEGGVPHHPAERGDQRQPNRHRQSRRMGLRDDHAAPGDADRQ